MAAPESSNRLMMKLFPLLLVLVSWLLTGCAMSDTPGGGGGGYGSMGGATPANPASRGPFKLGIDVLASENFSILQGKRVGLVTNQTGVNGNGEKTRVVLKRAVNLVALYTPEHGLDGTELAGKYVSTRKDPLTGLPAYSLYGKTRKPTPEMLAGVDILVFDMQDIGCRSYTYISTMAKCMEACGELGIPFVVLDRPNPMGGIQIEGPSVEPQWISFVSQFPIPYRHGLTVGELAYMSNNKGYTKPRCKLQVVKMQGYNRAMTWSDTGLRWVRTSPNIPRATSPLYYTATGIAGSGSGFDIGVGGPYPFEYVAAPFLPQQEFLAYLRRLDMPGVTFAPYKSGVKINIHPHSTANLTALNLYILGYGQKNSKRSLFKKNDPHSILYKVYGSSSIKSYVESGRSIDALVASWEPNERRFRAERAPYLLYP
jgi:uncharacterized protein YbbC (DUF1343 family)